MVSGASAPQDSIGYTLFYATDFIFTGLAVAVAFHAGLFNIGGEGQAYIGGLGAGLVCLACGSGSSVGRAARWRSPPARLFGAAWAFVPAWLQARRGSHIVITTIMFNFIASALMTYLLVNVLIKPGQQSPETREFGQGAAMPAVHEVLGRMGITFAPLAVQPRLTPRPRRLPPRLGLYLAHPLGLRPEGRRAESRRPRFTRGSPRRGRRSSRC